MQGGLRGELKECANSTSEYAKQCPPRDFSRTDVALRDPWPTWVACLTVAAVALGRRCLTVLG